MAEADEVADLRERLAKAEQRNEDDRRLGRSLISGLCSDWLCLGCGIRKGERRDYATCATCEGRIVVGTAEDVDAVAALRAEVASLQARISDFEKYTEIMCPDCGAPTDGLPDGWPA
jgi:DNA-directed RNA polymerase subunit RPC12/RpoP